MESKLAAEQVLNSFIKLSKNMRKIFDFKFSHSTMRQFSTLKYLENYGACNLKEFSKRLNVSSSSLCIMLRKLEEKGLIERKHSENDRRNIIYSLSSKGKNFLNEEKEIRLDSLKKKVEKLDDAEIENFCYHLKSANEIIEKLIKKD